MYTVLQTQEFQDWLDALKDKRGRLRIVARVRHAEAGNLGDWKVIDGPLCEMRVDFGPGYRVYFARRGKLLIVLLVGGDKSTQSKDIARAKRLLKQLELK